MLFNDFVRAIALSPTSQTFFFKRTTETQRTQRKSDRTPLTPQTAIAPLQLPKQRSHPSNFPNSDHTPSTSPKAIALPPTSQIANCLQQRFAIAPPQLPNSDRTPQLPQKRSHPLNSPTSFFNEPRRHEEREGRREESAIA
ncbi:MAG: hypothetical protein HEQ10_15865 [Dolichospermum sp. DEX182a]|nr:hypothetical protein [Dolichospermum sp. DEX182a]